jgi:hypothetical protein
MASFIPCQGVDVCVNVRVYCRVLCVWTYEVSALFHGMAHSQIVRAGDGVKILRIASNILDNQDRQPTEGDSPCFCLGGRLPTCYHTQRVAKHCAWPRILGWFLWSQ